MAFNAQTVESITSALEASNADILAGIIQDQIEAHAPARERRQDLQLRYKGEVPIKGRTLRNPHKVNNKLANDFFGDIVDTKQGYMGNDISIVVDKERYPSEGAYEEAAGTIQAHRVRNNSGHEDSEMVKAAAVTGMGVRLLYVDNEEKVKTIRLPSWEIIPIYDASIFELQYAIRYYEVVEVAPDKSHKTIIRAELYDATNISYWIQDDPHGKFMREPREMNPQPHGFDGVPIVVFPNNEERMGDCEKVLSLIDAYDRTLSDVNSEVEQLRLAYMYLKGAGMDVDDEFMNQIRQTGVFPLEADGEIGFVNKVLDDGIIEHHLDRLERNIMRFAKSIDFNSEEFGGNVPVIAFQIKVAALAHKSMITERLFTAALRQQWSLITDFWRRFDGIDIDPMALDFVFTRQAPMNVAEEIEMFVMGKGHLSTKTLLSLLSFVDDVDAEMRRIEEERQLYDDMRIETVETDQTDEDNAD